MQNLQLMTYKLNPLGLFLFTIIVSSVFLLNTGCANMIPPTGGPRDSLPPVLINAVPADSTTNFSADRITLYFDEYIELQNVFENVIVSPLPKSVPAITHKLKTINIRLKDTLEVNTTYSINFGNAIRDVNEGNVLQDFTYVFSTGRQLDLYTITGRVLMAETGMVDSTLIVVLHKNLDDSAVVKEKPRYLTKVNGDGFFEFRNLAPAKYAIYALPNEFSRRYDDTTKPFAFADSAVNSADSSRVTLYAYTLPKIDTVSRAVAAPAKSQAQQSNRPLKFSSNLESGTLDLLQNLVLVFDRYATTIDSTKVSLTDKEYNNQSFSLRRDTTATGVIVAHTWKPGTEYNLIIDSTAFSDSLARHLATTDTVNFVTKRNEDYGSVRIRFTNLDLSKHPVLQIVQNNKIVTAAKLTEREWSSKLFLPGEYDLRILYDRNNNGKWDAGSFFNGRIQPERVLHLNTDLKVRANWDNEKEIIL